MKLLLRSASGRARPSSRHPGGEPPLEDPSDARGGAAYFVALPGADRAVVESEPAGKRFLVARQKQRGNDGWWAAPEGPHQCSSLPASLAGWPTEAGTKSDSPTPPLPSSPR